MSTGSDNDKRESDRGSEQRDSEPHGIDWREHGVRVIKGDQLDSNTAQTPGMQRAAAEAASIGRAA